MSIQGRRLPDSLGQKPAAESLPVVLASDQTVVIDTVFETGATDDAAAAGQFFPGGILYQAPGSVDEIDDGDVGRVRGTARRAIIQAPDFSYLELTAAEPSPANSDITGIRLTDVLTSADFEIRDTAIHYIRIPMRVAGWRHLSIGIFHVNAHDQIITANVYGLSRHIASTSFAAHAPVLLATWTLNTSNNRSLGISVGATGQDGTIGGSGAATQAHYQISAINDYAWICVALSATIAPTAGSEIIHVTRTT